MEGYYPVSAYYPLLEILILSFNAILFVLLSFLIARGFRKPRTQWGGCLYPASIFTLAVYFVAHLANHFAAGLQGGGSAMIYWPEMTARHLIPPLVFHVFYRNEKGGLPAPRIWQTCLIALYALGVLSGACAINTSALGLFAAYPGWPAVNLLGRVVMACGAASAGLVLLVSRRPRTGALDRGQHRWLTVVCGLWFFVSLIGGVLPGDLAGALEKTPPLALVLVVTYYVERFTFFDVVLKQGAFVFVSLCLLTLYFVFFSPLLLHFRFSTWIGSLAWVLSICPIVLLAPWGHRRLSSWIDRRWLGRRFSPAEATKYFLNGLQGAIGERELVQLAGAHMETIFRCRVEVSFIELEPPHDAAAECVIAPIRLGGRTMGEVRLYPGEFSTRFLSEDSTLLSSLADGLAFLLENLRLREKRLEQEKRESELILNANRSELKALRAQVNPHFLFNALNTIAALIPNNPCRAEETVEELAEVFRYALHRSEREWVRMGEELDAIRAYLHVEEARFGDRLGTRISAADGTRDVRIPAMIIQTLVENAVKHGIAALTTPGLVDVRAYISGSRLHIEVRDNGPGFGKPALQLALRPAAGYGLRNVRDRLTGYFGDAARLSIGRDPDCGMTLVGIEMPASTPELAGAAQ